MFGRFNGGTDHVKWLNEMRAQVLPEVLLVVDHVWNHRNLFIQWAARGDCWWPGCVRVRFHKYSTDQRAELKAAKIRVDTRSNGPAIMAFLLAEGSRPDRDFPGRQWSIHHIYDGKFPAPNRTLTAHAVKDGSLFTDTAGLVAVHPVADALADEVAYFAWLLRFEAFERFGFDPDFVFSAKEQPNL
ncbi:hypothetical protein [Chlorobium sp.]|uniref:hypothetical protein n=1 Tax=Chlorobium sp. TaxID=1095 RepID=UPI003C704998